MIKQAASSLIGISLFYLCSCTSYADNISPTNANIRYVGRFVASNSSAPRMYWSGSHIIAWFKGTSCQVKLNCAGGNDFFNIIIDDGIPVKHDLAAGLQTITAASGLTNGVHKIEVFKRTSYQKDNTAFEGFITDAGKGLAPLPPAPAIKIQFYGDSITDGYSVDSASDSDAATYWNNYLTYAAITARNLNMQYVSTSASGIAVLHPWAPGFIMDEYYDRTNPQDGNPANKWDFSQYVPDIVVINLFQNDSWLKPSPHTPQEEDDIITAYEDLLINIRAAHTNAQIICTLGNMDATSSGSVWPGYISNAVDRMITNHGETKIGTTIFPYKGAAGHPVASEQAIMATQLTSYIQTNFGYLFTDDNDGDGQSNVDEIALGTDPEDPNSSFGLASNAVLTATDEIQLSWPSQTGVRYRILESPDLSVWNTNSWTDAQTPPEDSTTINLSPSNGFFKVEAEL